MFFYYLQTVPANARIMLKYHLLPQYAAGMVAVVSVTTVYLILSWLKPQYVRTWIAVPAFLFIAIVGVWPEERMRESMRKPFVAGQYIYGNQVIARDVPGKGILGEVDLIADKGYLELHPFIPERLRTITSDNKLEVGALLTKIACANCHALKPGAPLRSLPDKFFHSTDKEMIAAFLAGPLKHGAIPFMPRIDLPEDEIDAIPSYIALAERVRSPPQANPRRSPKTGPTFDPEQLIMDIGSVMHAMRDQAGIPAIPALFQFLMVFTWIFHIAFVTLTLGAAALSDLAFYVHAGNEDWERLSIAMTKVAKVGVSLLIVLGVAPLLFTQVIYDPQWYASNVLSGRWVIGFIASLIVGYCLWFCLLLRQP